jgi:heme-degrading monooxygenase HmoA
MPNIGSEFSGQTVITTFEVTPGTCQDLIDELTLAYAEVISKCPGFIGSALHLNDAQTRVANYSQWRGRADFMAMLRLPEMRERNRRLNGLCKSFEPVMYEVVSSYN